MIVRKVACSEHILRMQLDQEFSQREEREKADMEARHKRETEAAQTELETNLREMVEIQVCSVRMHAWSLVYLFFAE